VPVDVFPRLWSSVYERVRSYSDDIAVLIMQPLDLDVELSSEFPIEVW